MKHQKKVTKKQSRLSEEPQVFKHIFSTLFTEVFCLDEAAALFYDTVFNTPGNDRQNT